MRKELPMAKPKPTFCKNCGEGVECKTFNRTGKVCRKGKAKGKAVAQKTIDKREAYDSLLGDLNTDYLNNMRDRQIKRIVDEETGEILGVDTGIGKIFSFERYLNLIGEKTLASYYRYHYSDRTDEFDFKP